MTRPLPLWRDESMEPLGEADQTLNALWRTLYGEPLPLRGAARLALKIILENEKLSCLQESAAGEIHGGFRPSKPLSSS